MSRYRISIRLRLAIGLGLVLAVFSAALLLVLYHLADLRRINEEVTARMEVRRQAMATVRAAQLLESGFPAAEPADPADLERFNFVYNRLLQGLNTLLAQQTEQPERTYLSELREASTNLKAILDRLTNRDAGGPQEDPEELARQSKQILSRIETLNSHLVDIFDIRVTGAGEKAQAAWAISSAIFQVIFPVALLVSLLIIYYTHRSVAGPVGALVTGTKTLAEGNLASDIQIDGSGEFRELAESFNRMARALQVNQKQLIEAEKMASVGRLAAGVAHEINNPITVIIGHAKMLLATMDEQSPDREQLQTIADEALQCKNIVNSLLDLSRPSETTPGEVLNPNDVIVEVINMVQALQLADGVRIDASVIDRPIPLTISRARLRQLALNIVRNAMEALRGRPDGRVQVEGYIRPRTKLAPTSLKEASEASSFLIFVFTDNGPGIAAQDMGRLFEPFFTTKADGTGLGLAISYKIARAHGGFIEAHCSPAEGTVFTVGLPVSEEGRTD